MRKLKLLVLLSLTLLTCERMNAQFYSISSNIIGDATLNLNAEFSMTLNRNWSLHLPLMYNPFIYKKESLDNKKFQNLTFSPGVRYWLKESYRSNFIGIYLISSRYHVSKIFDDYRYDGYALGAGLSYGHAYPLAKRWNIEWEAGLGLTYLWYDKYLCKKCGKFLGHEKTFKILPSRVAASLIYLF